MDELDEIDELLIGKELSGGWVIREPRRIERDAPSACRSYVAHDAQGRVAFVKLLDPRANGALEDTQRQFEQFIYEKGVVVACKERNMRRVIQGLA